jgi:hypothetical protein
MDINAKNITSFLSDMIDDYFDGYSGHEEKKHTDDATEVEELSDTELLMKTNSGEEYMIRVKKL